MLAEVWLEVMVTVEVCFEVVEVYTKVEFEMECMVVSLILEEVYTEVLSVE